MQEGQRHMRAIIKINFFLALLVLVSSGVFWFWLKWGVVSKNQNYSNVSQSAPQTKFNLSGREIFATNDDALLFLRWEDGTLNEVANLENSNVLTGSWLAKKQELVLVETDARGQEENRYYFKKYSTASQKEILYWTRTEIMDLSNSFNNRFLSWLEDDALYLYSLETANVERLSESVKEYVWSPSRSALVVTTSDRTKYYEIDEKGRQASELEIFSRPFRGLVFYDEKKILGVKLVDNDLDHVQWELGEIDLSSLEVMTRDLSRQWHGVTLKDNTRFQTEISADKRFLLLALTYGEQKILEIYDFNDWSVKYQATEGHFLKWLTSEEILISVPADEGVLLQQVNFLKGTKKNVGSYDAILF